MQSRFLLLALGGLLAATLPGCSSDSDRMSIVEVFPPGRSVDNEPSTQVWVKFSTAVRESSVSSKTLRVTGSESGAATGTFTFSAKNRRVIFLPAQPFLAGETVTVKVTSRIRGKSGVSSKRRKFWFRIKDSDPAPPAPRVASRDPAPGATGVGPAAPVTIGFDQKMNPFTFNEETVSLVGSLTGPIPLLITEIIDSGDRLVLVPQRDYLPGERITVILGSGLTSTANVTFGGETYSFLAGSEPPAATLERGPDIPASGKIVESIAADLDGDGILDLVARAGDATEIQLFRGAGKGRFESLAPLAVEQRVLSIAVLDVSGDGLLDILAGTIDRLLRFENTTSPGPAGMEGLEGLGLGGLGGLGDLGNPADPGGAALTFGPATAIATGTPSHGIAPGDLDHAAIRQPDVILDTDRGLQVYLGGLQGPPAQSLGETRLSRTSLVLRDVDADGFLDLVYGDTEGNRIAIHPYSPGEGLGSSHPLNLSNDAVEVHVDDLDGDGSPEFISLVPDAETGGESIHIGGSDGSPAGELLLLPTLGPSTLRLADLDGDGWIDILVGNAEAATIRLLRNQQGAFLLDGEPEILLRDEPVAHLITGDFTGDGVVDILAAAGQRLIPLLSELEAPPPPPDNRLAIASTQAEPGARDIPVELILSNESVLEGYTVAVLFDATVLNATAILIDGTVTGELEPEFVVPQIENAGGYLTYNAVFDFFPPFEGKSLAPGENQVLFRSIFTVASDAAPGDYPLTLPESVGPLPTHTVLVSGGVSVPHAASDGVFTVLPPPPPPANVLAVAPAQAGAGARGVPVDILLSNESSLDAFTVLLGFDPAVLQATAVSLEGTVTGSQAPDVVEPLLDNAAGFASLRVVLDSQEPPGEKRIAPGESQVLLRVLFDVLETAPPGTRSPLTLPASIPELGTRAVLLSGQSELPFLTEEGLFTVDAGPPPPPTNVLGFQSVEAKQGDQGVALGVTLSNESPINAFTVLVGFDPAALTPVKVSLAGSTTGELDPDFTNARIPRDGNHVGMDVVFDLGSPVDGKQLLPGSNQVLFQPVFDVPHETPVGEYGLRILETTADAESTRLISRGQPAPYTTVDGSFRVLEGPPPPENPNKLRLESVEGVAGSSGHRATVYLTSVQDTRAFTLTGVHDPASYTLVDVDITGTVTEALEPELVVTKIEHDPVAYFAFSTIFELSPPFEGLVIEPGVDMPLAHLLVEIPPTTAPGEYALELQNELGSPPLSNTIIEVGFNIFPEISGGRVIVTEAPPAITFIRGDANGSAKLDIADHIFLVNHIFKNGPAPPCMDAADIDDNGTVEVLDVILILDFIFKGTFFPASPFPESGPDPTESDGIDCLRGL